ncbi:hypothetical protein LINGRAHAP2_LOCUS13128 [Linum grandiflorum]
MAVQARPCNQRVEPIMEASLSPVLVKGRRSRNA